MRSLILFLSFVTLTACSDLPFGLGNTRHPAGSHLITPSATYAQWWQDVERCSGKSRPMSDISFYVVGNDSTFAFYYGIRWLLGLYMHPNYGIAIAGGYADSAGTVRHEMLHAMRYDIGDGHDSTDFLVKCKGIVTVGPMDPITH